MREIKVFVVGHSVGYARWIQNYRLVKDISEADLVLFTGGEDISPSIYGKVRHPYSSFNTSRDRFELNAYAQVRPDQLCFGTCRGAQLACALNGGILVQDCEKHSCWGSHGMRARQTEYAGVLLPEVLETSSLHHQMMYPYTIPTKDYTMLYVSDTIRSSYHAGDGVEEAIIQQWGEPEIILFHASNKPRFLAVQGHPEMMVNSELASFLNNLVTNLLKA